MPVTRSLALRLVFSLPVLWCLIAAYAAGAQAVPPLESRVNDRAGMLSAGTVRQLETALAELERTDGTQIAVLTVPSLEGESIETLSLRVAEAWRIGQKGRDNGAILIIARNDRKVRIEVGYGLEGQLTDLVAGRIIRNVIVPRFKAGQFDQGVIDGVSAMTAAVQGAYTAEDAEGYRTGEPVSMEGGVFSIMAAAALANGIGRIHMLLGGLVGAVALPLIVRLFFGIVFPAVLAFFPIGLAAGIIIAAAGRSRSRSGLDRTRRGRRSMGQAFGDGFRGGFSSGGGFSGSGGGFGGGGASGGW